MEATSLGERAFYSCSSLSNISLSSSLTKFSDNTFQNCNNLREITIPNGISSFGSLTFTYTNIQKITFHNSNVPNNSDLPSGSSTNPSNNPDLPSGSTSDSNSNSPKRKSGIPILISKRSPKINQSQYQNKRKPLNYSKNNTLNNNNYDNRVNSSEPELNIFNNQVTDSLNDFDNLEEEQVEFRNEEPYKNYGFKFNEIPIIKSGGKINSQKIFKQNIINNIKPLTKPQTNKRNLTNENAYKIKALT